MYTTKLIENLECFTYFVQDMDGNNRPISFRDSAGFLGREEDYKTKVAEEARKELGFKKWKKSEIGTGKISKCARSAISKASNLVNIYSQIDFKNRLDPSNSKYCPDAEKILFNLYCNPQYDERMAFNETVAAFGGKYDTIAFLFFIKDDSRFLPISTGHFDKGFELLGIKYKTSHQCSWDNYKGYIDVINDIYNVMKEVLPLFGTIKLIDAHSFVWIIQQNRFSEWKKNHKHGAEIIHKLEEDIHRLVSAPVSYKTVNSMVYSRNAEVVKETKKRANGICQLCNQEAPFTDNNGNPYLEVHHIIWLSKGGSDSTDNTAALCPNCHKKMHILNNKKDIDKLLKIIGKEI